MAARPTELRVAHQPPAPALVLSDPDHPLLSLPHELGTYHSWKLAAWVESQKLMPITAVVDSPGARDSE